MSEHNSQERTHSTSSNREKAERSRFFNLYLALLLLGFGCLYLLESWERDFWSPEEPAFASVCREMGEAGNWLVPTIAGQHYFEKPPLLYWCSLVFEKICLLEPHLAYRIPSALFGVLGLWVTYICGVIFFNRSVGLLALLIQGTSYLYFHSASWLHTDMIFSSGISLSVVSFAVVLSSEPYAKRWKCLGYLGLVLACLSKSLLLAPYLVFVPLLLFLYFERGLQGLVPGLKSLKPWVGLIVVLVCVSPWYIWVGFEFGGQFFQEMFVEHHFQRLLDSESHARSIGYYLIYLPLDFLPWSFFIPLALLYGHVHCRRAGPKLCYLWLIITFVTLSLVSSKQGKYLLPLWTPLSLLVAGGLLETKRESIWEEFLGPGLLRCFPWLLRIVAVVLIVAAALWFFGRVPGIAENSPLLSLTEDQDVRVKTTILAGISAVAFLAVAMQARRELAKRQASRAVYWICGACAMFYLVWTFSYGELNRVKSARNFCERADNIIQGHTVAIYGTARPSIVYYLKSPLRIIFEELDPEGKHPEREAKLEAYLGASDQRFLLVFKEKWKDGDWQGHDLRRLEGNFPRFTHLYREVETGTVSSRRRYAILTNKTSK